MIRGHAERRTWLDEHDSCGTPFTLHESHFDCSGHQNDKSGWLGDKPFWRIAPMFQHLRYRTIGVLLGLASSIWLSTPSFSAVRCKDLVYGNSNYSEKMDELAALAKLPDDAWSRNHETLAGYLCKGKTDDANQLVQSGVVSAEDAQRMAAVLGKAYKPPRTSKTAKSYVSVKTQLIAEGVCNACADNAAQNFVRKPSSQCAILVQRALDGDSRAIDELVTAFPDLCKWHYE
jgi:hypothetical protein